MDTLPTFRETFRHAGRLALILVATGTVAAQFSTKSNAPPEPPPLPSPTGTPMPPPSTEWPMDASKWQMQVIVFPSVAPPPPLPLHTAADTDRFIRDLSDRILLADSRVQPGPTMTASWWLDASEPAVEDPRLVTQAVALASGVETVAESPAAIPETALPPLQPVPTSVPPLVAIQTIPAATGDVVPAGCTTCGPKIPGAAINLLAGEYDECVPGREGFASGAAPKTAVGRFLHGIYQCVCYPDPCYEANWTPLQDTAFFTPTARPVTQSRFRAHLTRGIGTPDRAEYFWPKGVGSTRGPRSPDGRRVRRVDDDLFSIYNEAASGMIGVYSEMRYRRVRPDAGPGASGFGDLMLGTKTLLHDSELLQVAFQMETTIPSANSEKGLGTGHLTLEPSVIIGIKLSQNSHFQAQVAEWIPIAGDPDYAGSALRYSFAYNHVLCRPLPDCPIIGTMELIGTTFQDGQFTDPDTGAARRASGQTFLAIGPGVRAFIFDKVDLGVGSAYGVGSSAGPRQEYRIELRVRY